ncbi:MAG: hypothetical protein LBH07_09050 [Treponema sp.]|jgi:cytidylate kinase|nr:hypothetical protein [Treponema sp.]
MKKIGFIIVGIIIAGLFFNSCATETGTTGQYTYELFRLTKANFNRVPQPETANFNAGKAFKDSLRRYSVQNHGSGVASQGEIRSLLVKQGATRAYANNAVKYLNTIGNNVLWFNYAQDDSFNVVLYLEKIQQR